jgi:hypothetical protein
MSTQPARPKRPVAVSVLVALTVLNGLANILGGLLIAAFRNYQSLQVEFGADESTLLWIGITSIALGVVYLLVARGLANGNSFTRFLVGLVSVLNFIGGIWVAIAYSGQVRTQAVVSVVVAVVILVILYTPKASAFFRQG